MQDERLFAEICGDLPPGNGFGLPPELRRELFLPPANRWLTAGRQWVCQHAEAPDGGQHPLKTDPALWRILQECESPDHEVARLHLDCAAVACAAARLLSASSSAGGTGAPAATIVQLAWDGMALAWHRPASEAGSPQARDAQDEVIKQIQGWVSASAAPADICGRVLSGAAEYFADKLGWPRRPDGRSWEYWHLLRSAWLGDLAKYLLGKQESGRTTPALLALVDGRDDQRKAIPVDFVFEALSTGDGEVFIAPEQAFMRFTNRFEAIFDDVPAAVVTLLTTQPNKPERHDVRLSLQHIDISDEGASPESRRLLDLEELSGPSATGAAGRGLYYAWSGLVPDDGVAVLAAMDKCGTLAPVEHVTRKTEALVRVPWTDTIAVVGEANRTESEAALGHRAGEIAVVDLEKVECPPS